MEIMMGRGGEKTKPIAGRWPEIRSSNSEIRNELNGCDLKKQSQFHED